MKLTLLAFLTALGAGIAASLTYVRFRSKSNRARDYARTVGRGVSAARSGRAHLVAMFSTSKKASRRGPRKPDPTPQAA